MKKAYISNNVIRRLPRYLRRLDELIDENVERVSSSELGAQMGLTPSQIRQDFSQFDRFGQQGYGYNVKVLRDAVANILGTKRNYSAVLVGVGNIGHALLENFLFESQGVRFLGAFEIKPELVGTTIGGAPIMSVSDQREFIAANDVDIAILTVPRTEAQSVADELIDCGIKAIWNFTGVEIDTGDSGVVVESIHFADSLLTLSYYLSDAQDEKGNQ